MKKTNNPIFNHDFAPFIVFILFFFFLIFGMAIKGHAYNVEDVVKAVIGEAEGEPMDGKIAVACAIRNRGTLSGVYGLHAKRVREHKYSNKTLQDAIEAVKESQDPELCTYLINGASFWEGTKFPIPYWAKGMTITTVIGSQRFFRKD